MDRGADAHDMHVLSWVCLPLKPGRIPIPDLVVTSAIDLDEPVVPAHAAKLVGEVLSPESTTIVD